MEKYKYPKTFHFLNSKPNFHGNDRVHLNNEHFIGKEIICSEKMDGENTTLGHNYLHARSLDSGAHPSRTWIKAFHASIKHLISQNYRLCGENLQAKHSIFYDQLPTYFLLFGIYNDKNFCLSWDETIELAKIIGVETVPVLYRGIFDEEKVKACFTDKSAFGKSLQEGYVVRLAGEFHYDNFAISTSKFVKNNFVPGDTEHWSKTTYMPNKLKTK